MKKTILKTYCPGWAMTYANDIIYVGHWDEPIITLYRLRDGNLDGDGFDITISDNNKGIWYLHCTEHFLFAQDTNYEVFILDIEDLKASKYTCIRKIKSDFYFNVHSFDGKIFYRKGKRIILFNVDPSQENQEVELEQKEYRSSMTNYKEDLLVGIKDHGIVIIDSDTMKVKKTIKTDCCHNLIIHDDFLYGSNESDIYKVKMDNLENIKKVGKHEECIISMHVCKGFLFTRGLDYISVYSLYIDLLQRYKIRCEGLCSTPDYLYCMSGPIFYITLSRLDIELNDNENNQDA